MLCNDEDVPIIKSLHWGFVGGFANKLAKECSTGLLKSGPVCTYSTILSILSITIKDEVDLYASLKTLSILLIFPKGPIPTNFSGEIIFTKLNRDYLAKAEAIVVVPDPCFPYNKTTFSLLDPFKAKSALFSSFFFIIWNSFP